MKLKSSNMTVNVAFQDFCFSISFENITILKSLHCISKLFQTLQHNDKHFLWVFDHVLQMNTE